MTVLLITIWLIVATIVIYPVCRERKIPTYWKRNKNGVYEFCKCGKPECLICNQGRNADN